MITDDDVNRFKLLYLEKFNDHLDSEEATVQLRKLVSLVQQTYKPLLHTYEDENEHKRLAGYKQKI